MNRSANPNVAHRSALRYLAVPTLTALGLTGMVACGAPKAESVASPSATSSPTTTATGTQLSSNFDHLHGPNNHCFGGGAPNYGGPRPCAPTFRTGPHLGDARINTNAAGTEHLDWPYEKIDRVTVLCYTNQGDTIFTSDNTGSSSDWYEVVVPITRIKNSDILNSLDSSTPLATPISENGTSAILAWGSVVWFGSTTPAASVPACQ